VLKTCGLTCGSPGGNPAVCATRSTGSRESRVNRDQAHTPHPPPKDLSSEQERPHTESVVESRKTERIPIDRSKWCR